jgi:hypothetical protein
MSASWLGWLIHATVGSLAGGAAVVAWMAKADPETLVAAAQFVRGSDGAWTHDVEVLADPATFSHRDG